MLRSDAVLEREIVAELACDAACRPALIRVAVKNGIASLSGAISDPVLRHAAVCAAKRVFGVDGVNEHFEIGSAPAGLPSNVAAAAAVAAL